MFDPSTISDVSYAILGASMRLTWSSTVPTQPFQVYVNGQLQASGVGLSVTIPRPQSDARIIIGSVGIGEQNTNFSSSLPASPASRAVLTWAGGYFEGADLHGFRIFGETTAGGGINYTVPLGDIEAYAPNLSTDGYGMGGYGSGGYGSVAAAYSWESLPYKTGTWNFAIVPYDQVGNLGTASTVAVSLVSAPAEVPYFTDNLRLHHTYSQTTHQTSITWQASTG